VSVYLFVCLPVCLSVCLSVFTSVCLFVCLSSFLHHEAPEVPRIVNYSSTLTCRTSMQLRALRQQTNPDRMASCVWVIQYIVL
jgi:hypothetical protein